MQDLVVGKLIAKGSFGDVHLCRWSGGGGGGGGEIAMKSIPTVEANYPTMQRFVREIRLLQRV
jgi:serine/threonine protein kinase